MKNTISFQKGNVRMVAHRGVSGLEKENTNAAFIVAANRSYFGIETDVHLTSDGKFVIIHDDDTNRVGGVDLSVEGSDYDTLRNLTLLPMEGRTSRSDIRIPNMEEYFDICSNYDKYSVFELKNHMPEEKVVEIVEKIRELGWLDHTIFISFDFENLTYVRKHYPDQACQYLIMDVFPDDLIDNLAKYHFALDVEYHLLNEERVKALKEKDILINCWTVNDPKDGEMLAKMGVDFITTNILE